jgi:hypothetical protein
MYAKMSICYAEARVRFVFVQVYMRFMINKPMQ